MRIIVIVIIRRIAMVVNLSASLQYTLCSYRSGVHGPEVLLRGYKKPQIAEEPFSWHQFRDLSEVHGTSNNPDPFVFSLRVLEEQMEAGSSVGNR